MQLQHMNYDATALKARLVQRHGSDVGEMVFNAEVNRRALQDARAAEMNTELAAINVQIVEQSWTHSLRQRDKWQLRSLQARISLERKESHDEEIPPQSFCGI